MRSPAEIIFRLRQELANLYLYAMKPRARIEPPPAPLDGLPDPRAVASRLQGTDYAATITATAGLIAAHRFPIFGELVDTGTEIDWRRDYVHGRSTPAPYFRRVPYLDFAASGDHKWVWELNRHQHLVVLAQAYLLTGDAGHVREIERQLRSWLDQSPFQCGINWTSALEVAFRALSWIWVFHLAGAELAPETRRDLIDGLHRHGLHLEYNLSVYFSPNTHLLGEAVALHAIGRLFPALPRAARWRTLGRRIVLRQMDFQIRKDGSHFEQSTYYHVYALDLFLLHHLLEPAPDFYRETMGRMAGFLDALLGPGRRLAFFGDDDGGRLFHPYGPRDGFGRATLATCGYVAGGGWRFSADDVPEQAAWWLGAVEPSPESLSPPPCSHLFADSGLASMTHGEAHLIVDAGPFGWGGAGHSHSDTLSLVAFLGDEEILIDPGTYTYIADAEWRDRFRGSAAHNTVRIGGRDQADPQGPFRWRSKPEVSVLCWTTNADYDFLDAACGRHRRRIVLVKAAAVALILDEAGGTEEVEQFWHPGERAARRLAFSRPAERLQGWRSRVYGHKEPAEVLCVRAHAPAMLGAAIDLGDGPGEPGLELRERRLEWSGRGIRVTATFPESGDPGLAIDGSAVSGNPR